MSKVSWERHGREMGGGRCCRKMAKRERIEKRRKEKKDAHR